MSNQQDQKINKIEELLSLQLKKRLKVRYEQKMKKHFSNCLYSTTFNRFYVCNHKNNLKKDSYLICTDDVCNNCPLFCCKYTKELINSEFKKDVSDPAICGNKEPKIAVLIWVLRLLKENNNIVSINDMENKENLWKRILKKLRIAK